MKTAWSVLLGLLKFASGGTHGTPSRTRDMEAPSLGNHANQSFHGLRVAFDSRDT